MYMQKRGIRQERTESREHVNNLSLKKLPEKAINKLFLTAISYPQIKKLKFSVFTNRIQWV